MVEQSLRLKSSTHRCGNKVRSGLKFHSNLQKSKAMSKVAPYWIPHKTWRDFGFLQCQDCLAHTYSAFYEKEWDELARYAKFWQCKSKRVYCPKCAVKYEYMEDLHPQEWERLRMVWSEQHPRSAIANEIMTDKRNCMELANKPERIKGLALPKPTRAPPNDRQQGTKRPESSDSPAGGQGTPTAGWVSKQQPQAVAVTNNGPAMSSMVTNSEIMEAVTGTQKAVDTGSACARHAQAGFSGDGQDNADVRKIGNAQKEIAKVVDDLKAVQETQNNLVLEINQMRNVTITTRTAIETAASGKTPMEVQ